MLQFHCVGTVDWCRDKLNKWLSGSDNEGPKAGGSHSLLTVQNPAKTVYFKTCSKCPPPAFTQARSLLTKLSMPCWWSSVADHHILFARQLQLVDGIWLGLKCRSSIAPQTCMGNQED